MVTLVNRARMTTSTTGTGTITLGSAEAGYQSFADAGVTDGAEVRYVIEEGASWELGTGVYTSSGTTLSRTPEESSNAGAAINLSGSASVFITAAAEDISSGVVSFDSKASAYTVTTDDIGKIINATGDGTFTVTIPGASTAGAGFNVKIWNTGDGTITISGGGVIDGGSLTSRVLYAWEGVELVSDGTNWYSGSTKSTRYYAENGNDGNTTRPIASGLYSIALGGASTASGVGSLAVGLSTTASGSSSNAFGRASANVGAVAAGNGSVALNGSYASGTDSFAAAIANNTSSYGATGANSVAIGHLAKATNSDSVAIGDTALSTGSRSVSIGYSNSSSGTGSLSLGYDTTASANRAVTIGESHTASAQNAVVVGPFGGTASGIYSLVLSCDSSQATATYSVAIGTRAYSDIQGKMAYASGRFSANGDAQTGTFVLRSDTTDATAEAMTTDNSAAGTTNQIILPNNSAYAFHGTIVARQQASQGTACAAWKIEGLIRREGSAGTTVLVNSATTVLDNTPGWGMALSADTTNGGLKIEVTGAAATNIRFVATVHTSEVSY